VGCPRISSRMIFLFHRATLEPSSFQTTRVVVILRYRDSSAVFDVDELFMPSR